MTRIWFHRELTIRFYKNCLRWQKLAGISICQLSLPWRDWPCIIIVVYAGLKWIGIPWKIALVWLYLFYQIEKIHVFLNSLFFVTGWTDWLAPKSIYGIFILIEYASSTKPTFGSKTSWSKKHFQNKYVFYFFFVFLFVKNSGCRNNFNQWSKVSVFSFYCIGWN